MKCSYLTLIATIMRYTTKSSAALSIHQLIFGDFLLQTWYMHCRPSASCLSTYYLVNISIHVHPFPLLWNETRKITISGKYVSSEQRAKSRRKHNVSSVRGSWPVARNCTLLSVMATWFFHDLSNAFFIFISYGPIKNNDIFIIRQKKGD